MASLSINDTDFLLDSTPFTLISGAIHYFRVPRAYWRDRLEKLKLMGCNTVETYIPWNLHEEKPGIFNFAGNLDVVAFLQEAWNLGLYAIVRPSPYICAELEFGGLPWWLLQDRTMRVRSMHHGFCQAVAAYYDVLIPKLVPLISTQGGPIIACQIENEYGYYGNEHSYLYFLKQAIIDRELDVLLFTSDGPWKDALYHGRVEGTVCTANFGSKTEEHFNTLRKVQKRGPLVCMEFWNGWFDAWKDTHHTRDPQEAANELREILLRGHVNIYMFHGGTNYGFTSGANHYERYLPDVTSYDYDAPLTEDGRCTEKFWTFKSTIADFLPSNPESRITLDIGKIAFKRLDCIDRISLWELLELFSPPVTNQYPMCMEDLDQGYGYVLYRVIVDHVLSDTTLSLYKCADRAQVFQSGEFLATRDPENMGVPIPLKEVSSRSVVDVLVENQGRVNFGYRLNDQRKGIDGAILFGGCQVGPCLHYRLPFTSFPKIIWDEYPQDSYIGGPALYRFIMVLGTDSEPYQPYVDTFLDMQMWGKGVVFINGTSIGRFWNCGPQQTLYAAGPLWRKGLNEIVVLETEGIACAELRFVDEPNL